MKSLARSSLANLPIKSLSVNQLMLFLKRQEIRSSARLSNYFLQVHLVQVAIHVLP
jgi:hypothetical protein